MDYYILLFSIVTGIITSILLIVLLSILATSKQKEKVRDLQFLENKADSTSKF